MSKRSLSRKEKTGRIIPEDGSQTGEFESVGMGGSYDYVDFEKPPTFSKEEADRILGRDKKPVGNLGEDPPMRDGLQYESSEPPPPADQSPAQAPAANPEGA